jgi:regulator of RNase E activity RraA
MNMPVKVGDVRVRNGDYVFADRDGVVVVPFESWPKVRALALRAIEKEWRVGMSVALGVPPKSIFDELGEF